MATHVPPEKGTAYTTYIALVSQADRNQEISQELDALKRRLGFELVGIPRYTQDGRTVADVVIVLRDD